MIDIERFISWAESRFLSIRISGKEIQINSIFDPDGNDSKYKLWCNPSGGKKECDSGVYHCWISGKKGTLIGLVMEVDKCSYGEACEILGYDSCDISSLEKKLELLFREPIQENTKTLSSLTLPKGATLLTDLPSWNRERKNAIEYLQSRKIPHEGLYLGLEFPYRSRILIPYYDRLGQLIYYNGRYIGPRKDVPKYLGPPKEIGIGKGDVVYMTKWESPGSSIHVTEGEFDAMTLSLCGFCGCAIGGSQLTEHQRKILTDYRVTLCSDGDRPGIQSLVRTGETLLSWGFRDIHYVRPPEGYKDWNELYQKFSGKIVEKYVNDHSKRLDEVALAKFHGLDSFSL